MGATSVVPIFYGGEAMILASGSPRRRRLLEELGIEVHVMPQDVDESRHAGEPPERLVERLARLKADSCLADPVVRDGGQTVLAADTIVWDSDGDVLGKPRDAAEAHHMLRALSGRESRVSTGVCVARADGSGDVTRRSFVETTRVLFWDLSDAQIDAYVRSGEPMDKAGAYGIQGRGRLLVRAIEGDYSNVVGLPVSRLVRELGDAFPEGRGLLERALSGDIGGTAGDGGETK